MKYFLAFDMKDSRENCRRYIVIPNRLIQRGLDVNNNLKVLCSYTTRFCDEGELKNDIIALIPDYSIYSKGELVIAWKRNDGGEENIYSNKVPYKEHCDYFNLEYLEKFMTNACYDFLFLEALFSEYQSHSYLMGELNQLWDSYANHMPTYVKKEAIRSFLQRLLYKNGAFEYAKLYKLVIFVANLSHIYKHELSESTKYSGVQKSFDGYSSSDIRLTDAQQFELEWLEDRARLRKLSDQ